MSFTLPFTQNNFLPINIKGSDAVTGTYGGVSILNNGKTELKGDTVVDTRVAIGTNVNPSYSLTTNGIINAGDFYKNGVPFSGGGTSSNAETINLTSDNSNTETYLTFSKTIDDSNNILYFDNTGNKLTYNPSTSTLTCAKLSGEASSSNSINLYLLENPEVDNTSYLINFSYAAGNGQLVFSTPGLTFNPQYNRIDCNITGSSASSASATTSQQIKLTSDNTDGTYFIPFSKTISPTNNTLYIDNETIPLTYNPSLFTLTAGKIDARVVLQEEKIEHQARRYVSGAVSTINIAFGDPETLIVNTSGISNVVLPTILALGNIGATFKISKINSLNMTLSVQGGASFYQENGVAITNFTFFGAMKCAVVQASYNNVNGTYAWRILFSGYGNTSYVMTLSNTQSVSGAKTWNNTNTWNGANTYSVLPTSTSPVTSATQLVTKAYVDSVIPVIPVDTGKVSLISDNTSGSYYLPFSKTTAETDNQLYIDNTTTPLTYNPNTSLLSCLQINIEDAAFNGNVTIYNLPEYFGGAVTPTTNNLITKGIADTYYCGLSSNNTISGINTFTGNIVSSGVNTFSGTNTFNTSLPTSTVTPTSNTDLVTKVYSDGILGRENVWTNVNTFSGYFLPQVGTTNYRMGMFAMENLYTTGVNNIAFGNYSLKGGDTTPPYLNNTSSQNVCIGNFSGQALYTVDGNPANACNNNVAIGFNTLSQAYLGSKNNVIIGTNAASSSVQIFDSCLIGTNVASQGTFFISSCVVIGSNSGINMSEVSLSTVVGAQNIPLGMANASTIFGAKNGEFSTQNGSGVIVGTECGKYLATDAGAIIIGARSGNLLTSGFVNTIIGADSSIVNPMATNVTLMGSQINYPGIDNTFVIGGNWAGLYQSLLISKKNRVLCNRSITTTDQTLNEDDPEHVIVENNTVTNINLFVPQSYNIGIRYTIVKTYSPYVSLTLTASPDLTIIGPNGNSNTYVMGSTASFITLVCINTIGTAWAVINEQSANTVNLTGDQTINGSKIFTSPIQIQQFKPAYANPSFIIRKVATTLLSFPLNEYYWVSAGGVGQVIQLPLITNDTQLGVTVRLRKNPSSVTTTLTTIRPFALPTQLYNLTNTIGDISWTTGSISFTSGQVLGTARNYTMSLSGLVATVPIIITVGGTEVTTSVRPDPITSQTGILSAGTLTLNAVNPLVSVGMIVAGAGITGGTLTYIVSGANLTWTLNRSITNPSNIRYFYASYFKTSGTVGLYPNMVTQASGSATTADFISEPNHLVGTVRCNNISYGSTPYLGSPSIFLSTPYPAPVGTGTFSFYNGNINVGERFIINNASVPDGVSVIINNLPSGQPVGTLSAPATLSNQAISLLPYTYSWFQTS